MKKIIALVIAALCLMSILPVSTLAASTYVVYIRFAFMKSADATVYSNLYYVSGSSSYTAKTSSTGTTMYSNAPQTFTVPSGYTCTKNSNIGSLGNIAWKISRSSSFTASGCCCICLTAQRNTSQPRCTILFCFNKSS